MKLGTKVSLCAAGGVVLATLGAIGTVYSISHENRVNELRLLMSSSIRQSETVMANMDELHGMGAFNSASQVGGSGDFHNSVLYRATPVVAAWDSVKGVAAARGFEFFTPSRPDVTARNAKNRMPEFDDVFRALGAGEPEYFVESGNV